MKSLIEQQIRVLCEKESLGYEVSWQEWFNAVVNSPLHCQQVITQAQSIGLPIASIDKPMRWSEDVAELLAKWPGVLFCVGSGEAHPQLHNPDYDFPDGLIATASRLFCALIEEKHGKGTSTAGD